MSARGNGSEAPASARLPMLPGYNVEQRTKSNFHKSQMFEVRNGMMAQFDRNENAYARGASMQSAFDSLVIPKATEEYKREMERDPKKFQASARGASSTGAQPAWIAFDRKVLRFFGYFKESVHASQLENFRVRRCVFYYYLEDGSMHIAEPRVENSGIPQGVFVKRHRVPSGKDGHILDLNDLQVGTELAIYGRVFRVVDADESTRAFYKEQLKVELAAAEEYPVDPFVEKVASKPRHFKKVIHPAKEFVEALKGKAVQDIPGTKKFLSNDGKVLRFFCRWDDNGLLGETRPYILHYYLADDTCEIVEVQQPNNGRDPFPCLLKRNRLPKNATSTQPDVSRIGMQAKDEKVAYYTDADFKVGGKVTAFGRELQIIGCDKFTQDHYVKNYGADPADYHEPVQESQDEELPKISPPPHNGIGSEEDSLGSFLYLMPKVPRRDFAKLLENDGINLRYLAKFVDPAVEDKDRRFIITYYMNNDTVSVFEKFERNSGFIGGKFFERNRIKNPATGKYFEAQDFFIGAIIEVNKFKFEIVEGDEYTLSYMKAVFGTTDSPAASAQAPKAAAGAAAAAPSPKRK